MELESQIIDKNHNAPVIILFGGSPIRWQEVLDLISEIGNLTIYGTLSEEEGISKLQGLDKVDLVLIGGRYDEIQRNRIRNFVSLNFPKAQITEPGYDYPYDNLRIKEDIKIKLKIK